MSDDITVDEGIWLSQSDSYSNLLPSTCDSVMVALRVFRCFIINILFPVSTIHCFAFSGGLIACGM